MTLEQFKEKHGWDPERDLDLVLKAEQKYPDDEELKKSELKQQVIIRDLLESIRDVSKKKKKKPLSDDPGLGKGLDKIFSVNNTFTDTKGTSMKDVYYFQGEYFEKIASEFVLTNQQTPAALMNMIVKLWSNKCFDADNDALNGLMKEFLTKLSWE